MELDNKYSVYDKINSRTISLDNKIQLLWETKVNSADVNLRKSVYLLRFHQYTIKKGM